MRSLESESEPDVPSFGSILGAEFLVAAQVQFELNPAKREVVSELRAHADDLRLERAVSGASTAIGSQLVVEVAGGADINVLGQGIGCAPVQMAINAALVLRQRVHEVVRKSRGHRGLDARRTRI